MVPTEVTIATHHGLTTAEAEVLRQRWGANELPDRGCRSPWEIASRQARSVMVALLLVAAIASWLAGDPGDAIAIGAILILNGVLGFLQDYRAEQALASLRKMAAPLCRVRRDGREVELPARDLVPGDIVYVDEGAAVPADLLLLESYGLGVQQAALTGEAEVVPKDAEAVVPSDAPLADRTNRIYSGTFVARGHAIGEVSAIGAATELGRIAELTQQAHAGPTPLELRMDEAARWIAGVAIAIVLVIVIAGGLRGESWRDMFLLGISMAVAAVPEGLPAVVTIALALGSRRMLERRALVRRLASVETLGSVTVICTDKTGTLTENRMRVADWLPVNGRHVQLMRCAALSTNVRASAEGWHGDPTEIALVEAAENAGFRKTDLEAEAHRVAEIPFDSRRKRMTTIHVTPHWLGDAAPFVAVSKGALDVMAAEDDPLIGRAEALAKNGQRVLGVAIRFLDRVPGRLEEAEQGMTLLGAAVLEDPLRAEAPGAIAQCRVAGIRPVLITGDHRETATAIARRLMGDVPAAVTGAEMQALGDNVWWSASVYARVAPEDKLRIVEALQQHGEIVAMTGDGVNDAPALKKADVGVAMGRIGTDVARQASDIVLLDDNFATIVAAVEEGRRVFANIRKALQYLLAGNMSEIAVVAAAPLLGMPLPLLPLQILWINLVTDGLPALALVTEPAEPGVMRRPPRRSTDPILAPIDWLRLVILKLLTTIAVLGLGWWAWQGKDPGWQSLVFQSLALAQVFLAFSFRSETHPVWQLGWWTNRALAWSLLATTVLQVLIAEVPWMSALLGLVPLTPLQWLLAAAAGLVPALLFEFYKALRRGLR